MPWTLACVHTGLVDKASLAAYLSLAECLAISPEHESMEAYEELLQSYFPLASLSPQDTVVGQFLIDSLVLLKFKDFCLAPLRVHLEAIKPLSISIALAPQRQGVPLSLSQSSGPFCFSDIL